MRIKLTLEQLMLLRKRSTGKPGGFQNYLMQLAYRVDDDTRELELSDEDLCKINRYATQYGQGGFESRLLKIFGRLLLAESARCKPPVTLDLFSNQTVSGLKIGD